MNKYRWKLTLADGKEYIVLHQESDVYKFLEMICKNDVITFELVDCIKDENMNINNIAVFKKQITSVQYFAIN